MRNGVGLLFMLLALGASAGSDAAEQTVEKRDYRCLFNHELLIITAKGMDAESIGAFVDKLAGTDVDAVMCCPTMWRTNLFPSEVDPSWRAYEPSEGLSKFKRYDYAMQYLQAGGDPVKDTLAACRKAGKDFFISYRMNDHHYITDLEWPTHNAIWREHPEYWLGDTDTSPYARDKDQVRLLNYMLPEVRDYYFGIIEELCVKYDVDGVELDFQRFPRFFHNDHMAEGTKVMTAFVGRIRTMLDRLGKARGKALQLCIRVPHTLELCARAGLDIPGWDAAGLVDMVNVSSFYIHTIELDIEGFKKQVKRAKVYGEMNYVTYQNKDKRRRYTTFEIYRASALNLFARGADGLSLFNWDYVPSKCRASMAKGLKGIADVEFLKTCPKDYAVYPGFGTFKAGNQKTVSLFVPDDAGMFSRSLLRVETEKPDASREIGVWLNGQRLKPCTHEDTELFPPVDHNEAYPVRDALRFYEVPLEHLKQGQPFMTGSGSPADRETGRNVEEASSLFTPVASPDAAGCRVYEEGSPERTPAISKQNEIIIRNLNKDTAPCKLFSMELALYR